ncbi:MAG: hypothetical protein ABI171_00605 [Collimonas sp.]|uniref:hypothetical protein n=1 Tax=Collimonas sp. TaxID=1963772 RepID=UPI003265CC19
MTNKDTARHWLAVDAVDNPPQARADLLAGMEKQLADFMRGVAQSEEISPPHLMSGHHACPCCSERGE